MQKLYRSETDKILFGVCGGLGEYFEVDPVLVRMLFILFSAMGGGGVVLYLLLAIIMPKNPIGSAEADREAKMKEFAHKASEKIGEFAHELKEGAKAAADGMKREHSEKKRSSFFGIVLVFLGIFFIVNEVMPMYWVGRRMFWPIALILFGLYLIVRKNRRHEELHAAKHEEHKKREEI